MKNPPWPPESLADFTPRQPGPLWIPSKCMRKSPSDSWVHYRSPLDAWVICRSHPDPWVPYRTPHQH